MLLFAYGTLMRNLPLHALIEGRAGFVATGSIRGRLVDLHGYPGALRGPGWIRGEVYRLEAPHLLGELDAAEGREFTRRPTAVRLEDRREVTAWAYWFTGPTGRSVPIPGGDYRRRATSDRPEPAQSAPLAKRGSR
jgi:gamma-glutamylcyclotransferase (GGCT)/AIG2-like uncharacterized protein YtfP